MGYHCASIPTKKYCQWGTSFKLLLNLHPHSDQTFRVSARGRKEGPGCGIHQGYWHSCVSYRNICSIAMLIYKFSKSHLGWVQVTSSILKTGPLCDLSYLIQTHKPSNNYERNRKEWFIKINKQINNKSKNINIKNENKNKPHIWKRA